MSNISMQKNIICVEWTVQTNSKKDEFYLLCGTVKSQSFILEDRKCHLELHTGMSNSEDAKLYFKRNLTQNTELDIMIFVTAICGKLQSTIAPEILKIRSGFELIWKHDCGKGLGNWLVFHIFIYPRVSQKDDCVQTASYINANEYLEILSKDLSELFISGIDHDAEIRCGEHTINAHKSVLSARSEVFKAMFESDMVEGRSGIIEVQNTDVSYLQEFIKYLYTGVLPELSFDMAKALFELGDQYLVKSLVPPCYDYLLDNLSPENCCKCLAFAEVHSLVKLKEASKNYILDKKVYLQDKLWLPFRNHLPKFAYELYMAAHERGDLKENSANLRNKRTR